MLNYIWLVMVVLSVAVALATGTLETVSAGMLERAKFAVIDLMLPMAGMITLWMGIMRLVEASGLIRIMARLLSPVMSFLFPDVPKGHPALGSIAMNMGANMLGAGNAATPMGLRAMEQLNRLNPNPGVASNAMVMLLALNTSAITLIPTSTIALLQARGAANPTDVIAPSILASFCGTVMAVLICRTLQHFPIFRVVPLPVDQQPEVVAVEEEAAVEEKRLHGWRRGLLWLSVIGFLAVMIGYVANPVAVVEWQKQAYQIVLGKAPDGVGWFLTIPGQWYMRLIKFVSVTAIPAAMGYFVLYAALAGVKVFEQMVDGAKDGMGVVFRVIPYVVAMLVAVSMFTQSGALRVLQALAVKVLSLPVISSLGFPVEVLPLVIVRPLSGGASTGVLGSIAAEHGADSLITKIAATMNGSTETTLYVAAVYFGAVGVRRMRHGVPTGLLADGCAMIFSVIFCRWILS
ncbi:MAG: nucleoside recognition domain protein [Verrucomicrobiales bacterium]|nr:nucleoside recognition domain protein [Verrucomicrobiales bacterium]